MDGEKWYQCDPRKNAACRKRMCFIYGGECELTSHAEYAANGPAGRPIEINPREQLRKKMKRKKDRKMNRYIIKAQLSPAGGGNPDFAPDKQLENGIEVDGFLLLTIENGKPGSQVMMGCSTLDIARAIAGDESEASSIIHQAVAIAEGLMKAAEIKKEDDRRRTAKGLAELLRAK